MTRITSLDGLRGLACLVVVIYHYDVLLGVAPAKLGILTNGPAAVAVFFLISGFVLTFSFSAERGIVAQLSRRLVRLGLPSLAAIIFAAMLHAAQRGRVTAALESTVRGIAQCATLHLAAGFGPFTTITVDPPLWTVVIELYGSTLVLLLVWVRGRSAVFHGALVVASFLMPGLNLLYLFALGHVAALLYRHRLGGAVVNSIGFFLVCAGIVLCSVNDFAPDPMAVRSMLSAQCGPILIFIGTLAAASVQNFLNHTVVQFFGRISFSIYLLHEPVFYLMSWVDTLLIKQSVVSHTGLISFSAGVALTIGAALWFERLVDKPSIALSRYLWRARLRPPLRPGIALPE